MEITTLACPPDMTDPNINPETAPIWEDAQGNEYWVASGYLDGDYITSDPVTAENNRVNAVVGVDGLTALSMMGLTPKDEAIDNG